MNKETKRRLRELPLEDLNMELLDAKKEVMKAEQEIMAGARRMAYGGTAGSLKQKYNLKNIRKRIAVIKTIMREKNE